jgi:hypothetical protein
MLGRYETRAADSVIVKCDLARKIGNLSPAPPLSLGRSL